MGPKMRKADKFRSTGKIILSGQGGRPNSVKEFISDLSDEYLHKSPFTQKPNSANAQAQSQENLGRIHIQIRQDIADTLLKLVFKRKSDPCIKGRKATQRAIIEEALESYFKSVGVYKKNDD
jgi:hypothetical protein